MCEYSKPCAESGEEPGVTFGRNPAVGHTRSRQRFGVRRSSGAFERPQAREKLQRTGALQDADASLHPPKIVENGFDGITPAET